MKESEVITTSVKVRTALLEQGRTKRWLCKQMGIHYTTLFSKLDNNYWTVGELLLLQKLLNID